MKHLWEATRDLHHACEAHTVGAAMASGNPPRDWYARWVSAILQIHKVTDPTLPSVVQRVSQLEKDLFELAYEFTPSIAAETYVNSLDTSEKVAGASYVLTGAHLMGGEIMRRRLINFPTNHLSWIDRKAALQALGVLRDRPDIVEPARNCFKALLLIMDEIEQNGVQD